MLGRVASSRHPSPRSFAHSCNVEHSKAALFPTLPLYDDLIAASAAAHKLPFLAQTPVHTLEKLAAISKADTFW
jgi:hypothetical protein